MKGLQRVRKLGVAFQYFKDVPAHHIAFLGLRASGECNQAFAFVKEKYTKLELEEKSLFGTPARTEMKVEVDMFGKPRRSGKRSGKRSVDIPTIVSSLQNSSKTKNLAHVKRIHDYIIKVGLGRNTELANLLVQIYGVCGSLPEARAVFEILSKRNPSCWNLMVMIYAQHGKLKDALLIFQQMPKRDVVSWNILIAAHIQQGCSEGAHSLFQQMPERDEISWNAINGSYRNSIEDIHQGTMLSWSSMIEAYALQGQLQNAFKIFEQMHGHDMISWTAMIIGYAENGHLKEALKFFYEMKNNGLKPTKPVFVAIVDACGKKGSLVQGQNIHLHAIERGFGSDSDVNHALLNMYVNCGSLCKAIKLFCNMNCKTIVSWNAMIDAYAQYGKSSEALQALHQMQQESIMHDSTTLSSILSSYKCIALEGGVCHWFVSLCQTYNLNQEIGHYNSAIYILVHAGHMDEVDDLIVNMPFEPNVISWMSVLDYCRINVNLGTSCPHAMAIFLADVQDIHIEIGWSQRKYLWMDL